MTSRAVVLALPVEGSAPLDRLAGLPLVLRAVLALQTCGVDEIVLAVLPGDELTIDCVRGDRRVSARIEVKEASTRLEAVAAIQGAAVLVAPHDAVASPVVYRALLADAHAGRATVVADDDANGPFVATPELVAELGREKAELDVALSRHSTVAPIGGWLASARTESGRQRAVRELFEACRKPHDGIVARHLNRHISIFISKRIVDRSISPNFVTGVALLLGIAAAACVSQASYASMLAGAALLQVNSIIDGIDGEIARVRFEHSKLGQWLDTVTDDVSNTLFYGATAIAAAHYPAPGPLLSATGWVAVGASLLTMLLYYSELRRLGSGDFYALDVGRQTPRSGLIGVVVGAGHKILKKDFFVLAFFVAAVPGWLVYTLPLMMAGTIATAVTGIGITMRRRHATR